MVMTKDSSGHFSFSHNILRVSLAGKEREAEIDSGADINLISLTVLLNLSVAFCNSFEQNQKH